VATNAVTADPLKAAEPEMDAAAAAAKGLGWVPKDHPLYGTAGYVGSQPAGGAAPPPADAGGGAAPPPTGGPAGANTVAGQGAASQTYSSTPGAAPGATTTNQGTQDVVRNSYLERATKPITDPRSGEAFRMQADTFAAGRERARRDQTADLAEGLAGTGQVGAQTVEQRLIDERSAQARGGFEADLVREDLQNQRADVENALKALGGMISEDQRNKLTEKLAELDAQLKTAALDASTKLGGAELNLKDKLGMAGINVDMLSMLLQDSQFGKTMGFNMADREAFWNNESLNKLLGGN
jgi:hypothetical protein